MFLSHFAFKHAMQNQQQHTQDRGSQNHAILPFNDKNKPCTILAHALTSWSLSYEWWVNAITLDYHFIYADEQFYLRADPKIWKIRLCFELANIIKAIELINVLWKV